MGREGTMVGRVILMIVIGLLMTTGCSFSYDGATDTGTGREKTPRPKAPKDADGVEVWDLRTRPTAQDVGMPNSQDYVAYTTDEPRTVRFLLPEDKVLETKLYLVVFDRVTVPATTDKTVVTGMDFHADPMSLDDAYVVMGDSLRAFGLNTLAVGQWRAEIEGRSTEGPSADLRIEGGGNTMVGYLGIGVGGVYDPLDGDDSVNIKYRINFQ